MEFYFKKIICFCAILALISCIDEQWYEVKNNDELTIEAIVEKGKKPVVYLTSSIALNNVTKNDVLRAMETAAKVEITHGNITEIATLAVDNNRYPSRYYRFDEIIGDTIDNYTLKVTLNNKIYTADTYIPKKAIIKSITTQTNQDVNGNEKKRININFKKSDELSYYKIYIKKSGEFTYTCAEPFLVASEIYTDETFNVPIDYVQKSVNHQSLLVKGNGYHLKIVAITPEEYLFWKSIKGDYLNNFFGVNTLPGTTYSNINNQAFGFFGGNNVYEIQYVIQ